MILLSGKYKDHKFIWYSKFTGFKCISDNGENFPFFEYSDLLNDLIQFTANYIYEKIRKAYPNMKKRDARSIVIEAFKENHTVICFYGYAETDKTIPHLCIEFYDNSIIREFIQNDHTVRFELIIHRKNKFITSGSRTIVTDYIMRSRYCITHVDDNRSGTILPNSPTIYWDKNLKYKVKR